MGCIPKKLCHQGSLIGETMHSDAAALGWHIPSVSNDWPMMVSRIQETIYSLDSGYRKALRDKSVKYINALRSFKDAHTMNLENPRKKMALSTVERFVVAEGRRPTPLGCELRGRRPRRELRRSLLYGETAGRQDARRGREQRRARVRGLPHGHRLRHERGGALCLPNGGDARDPRHRHSRHLEMRRRITATPEGRRRHARGAVHAAARAEAAVVLFLVCWRGKR